MLNGKFVWMEKSEGLDLEKGDVIEFVNGQSEYKNGEKSCRYESLEEWKCGNYLYELEPYKEHLTTKEMVAEYLKSGCSKVFMLLNSGGILTPQNHVGSGGVDNWLCWNCDNSSIFPICNQSDNKKWIEVNPNQERIDALNKFIKTDELSAIRLQGSIEDIHENLKVIEDAIKSYKSELKELEV